MINHQNLVVRKSFIFSLEIIKYSEQLELKGKYIISRQLLKSGTSVGANIAESQDAESKADFLHKLKLSLKELSETQYWLQLCHHSKNYPSPDFIIEEAKELKLIISKIIGSTKRNIYKQIIS